MQFNKNDVHSVTALVCLVVGLITFFSVNYLWLFAPYRYGMMGIIKNLVLNGICIWGIVYGKKTLKIEFGQKKGPRKGP